MMRLGGHALHVNLHAFTLRNGGGFFLALMLRFPLIVAKASNGCLGEGGKNQDQRQNNATHAQEKQCSTHDEPALN